MDRFVRGLAHDHVTTVQQDDDAGVLLVESARPRAELQSDPGYAIAEVPEGRLDLGFKVLERSY